MRTLLQDIRYALRQLVKTPGFTVTAVLTLALGIGANSAIFTLIDAVLMKSLPVSHPEALVRLGDRFDCCVQAGTREGDDYSIFSSKDYENLSRNVPEFESVAAMQAGSGFGSITARHPSGDNVAHPSRGEFVSGNYFQTLGLQPLAGRLLRPADDVKGAPMVAVLSHQAWQRDYQSDMSVVGSTFYLNTYPVTILGITPASFYGDSMRETTPDFYVPLAIEPVLGADFSNKTVDWLYIMGRARAGVSQAALQAKVSTVIHQSFEEKPWFQDEEGKKALAKSHVVLTSGAMGHAALQRDAKDVLYMLLSIAGLVLLIACANIANLVLVRGLARRAEISIRMAMGAERGRVMRQMLTESLVLSSIGGLTGVGVAYAGVKLLLRLMAAGHQTLPVSPSPSLLALGFSFAVSLLTGVIFGLAPAWITSKADPADALRGSNRSTGGSSSWLQRSLVVFQAALSLVLLVGAGLLMKSFTKLAHQNFGIETAHRVVVHMSPQNAGYKEEQLAPFYQQVRDSMRSIPGVQGASVALYSPLEGDSWGDGVTIQGHPKPGPRDNTGAYWGRVDSQFFGILGIHMLRGRGILDSDTANSTGVAVVNQAFVKRFFKNGEDPMGKHFGTHDMKSTGDYEIVGITPDVKYVSVREEPTPMFFLPLLQRSHTSSPEEVKLDQFSLYASAIILDTRGSIEGLEGRVRDALGRINPNLTVMTFQTYEDQIAGQTGKEKILGSLTLVFALLALVLASIGLYGVTSYMVARRTQEIGVRMALGADRNAVVSMVLRSAISQAGIGLLVGLPAALLCVRLIKSQMYQVQQFDPTVICIAVAALGAAACLAGWLPARRAASIDPMKALRTE
jgi:predicted permease